MPEPAALSISVNLEAGIEAWLATHVGAGLLLAGVTLLKGWDADGALTAKNISIVALTGEAQMAGLGPSGNETIPVEITVRTHVKDDTGATHRALEAALDTLLKDRNLAAIIQYYATNLIVMTAYLRGHRRQTVGNWRSYTRVLECFVAGVQPA